MFCHEQIEILNSDTSTPLVKKEWNRHNIWWNMRYIPTATQATNVLVPDIIILIYFNIGFKRLIVYNILHKSNSNSLFQVKIKNDWTVWSMRNTIRLHKDLVNKHFSLAHTTDAYFPRVTSFLNFCCLKC